MKFDQLSDKKVSPDINSSQQLAKDKGLDLYEVSEWYKRQYGGIKTISFDI